MPGTASPNSSGRLRAFLLLALILVVAAAVRAWHIDVAPFWLDEHLTVELSNGHGLAHLDLPRGQIISPVPDFIGLDSARPWYDIWINSSRDVHPPLFYMVLRAWREIVGQNDAAIRALSLVLSLVAIVALFIAVEAQAGATPALWASLLMALSAAQIEFAQETRSYMLLEACLLGACAALSRVEHLGCSRPRLLVLGTLFFAAAMTHLLALPLLAAMGMYALIRLRADTRRRVVGTMLAALALYTLVWGPFVIAQSDGYLTRTAFVRSSYWSLERWFYRVTSLPLDHFVSAPTRSQLVVSMGAWLYVLPLLLLRKQPGLLLWWLWLTIGVFAVAAADLARHGEMLSYLRYTLAAGPAAFALAAMMLAHLDGWFRHIVPLLLSLACLGAIQGAYIRYNPDWRSVGEFVTTHVGDDDILVMFDDQPDPWLARCNVVGIQYYAPNKPHVLALLGEPPPPALEQRIREARAVWLFAPPGEEAASKVVFPGSDIKEQRLFDHIGMLVRVELAPEPATSPEGSPADGSNRPEPPVQP